MCKYKQGDIVYLDFSPSVNNEIRGIRPAVIISTDEYNRRANYITVMPITKHGNHTLNTATNFVKISDTHMV